MLPIRSTEAATSKLCGASRRGVTMVELLVVLGISGLLLAQIHPGAMRVRARARVSSCQNNLYQCGVALNRSSGIGRINQGITVRLGYPNVIRRTVIPLFICPDDIGSQLIKECARTNYVVVPGEGRISGMDGAYKYSEVTDGLSNTFHSGEQDTAPNDPSACWWAPVGASCENPPNSTDSDGNKLSPAFRSLHKSGANFLLGDGSVRFVSDSIDLRVYHALATINGGEVVNSQR